jgi:GT2 family glycosyltransferase
LNDHDPLQDPGQPLLDLERDYRLLQSRYLRLVNSPGHKLLAAWNRFLSRIAPQSTRRGSIVDAATRGLDILLTYGWGTFLSQLRRPQDWLGRIGSATPRLDLTEAYQLWLAAHAFHESDRVSLEAAQRAWATQPLVSVLMPCYNPESDHLQVAVESVKAQVYSNWELCIASDGPQEPGVASLLSLYEGSNQRIVQAGSARRQGISAARNLARTIARGEFLAFLDHDDVLHPDALHRVVKLLNEDPSLDFIYTDNDQLTPDGVRINPALKPEWSPELLYCTNYVNHLIVARTSLFDKVGGFRPEVDGAEDHDFCLRVSRQTSRIGHVAAPVYSWRRRAGSASVSVAGKPWAFTAARRALDDHLREVGIEATVADTSIPGRFRLVSRRASRPTVSVIIPTRDQALLLRTCLGSLRSVAYQDLEIILVDNGTSDEEAREVIASHDGPVVSRPGDFNFSALVNAGAERATGEYLLLLNNDVSAQRDDWLEQMLVYAALPGVGAVGPRLFHADGSIQHEGIAMFAAGRFAYNVDWRGYMHMGELPHNCSAVTAACLLTPARLFAEVGGFDEDLAVSLNDVDYCQRLVKAGLRVVYTPHARLFHIGGATRADVNHPAEERMARERWDSNGMGRDPYLSPELAELISPFAAKSPRGEQPQGPPVIASALDRE